MENDMGRIFEEALTSAYVHALRRLDDAIEEPGTQGYFNGQT